MRLSTLACIGAFMMLLGSPCTGVFYSILYVKGIITYIHPLALIDLAVFHTGLLVFVYANILYWWERHHG